MSLSTQFIQTSTPKVSTLEPFSDTIPSDFGGALDANGISLKFVHATGKARNPGGLDPEAFRSLSISTISGLSDDGRLGRSASRGSRSRPTSNSPTALTTWHESFQHFWQRNRGLWLVAISQFFGASMSVTARLLELEGKGMHPIQVLFARMSITMVLCWTYMWYAKVPYFPLGMKEVRVMLVIRGLAGFFGIFGLYYSLLYLSLADSTIITFLAPTLAGYGCYLLFGEPYTRIEQIASFVSLLGVVLIARPTSLFKLSSEDPTTSTPISGHKNTTSNGYDFPTPTSAQRLSAIGVAMLGVVGAAIVVTVIRWIGRRAHPLISVNYFAVWCTLVSTIVLSTAPHLPAPFTSPDLRFELPQSLRQWSMLIFVGICGFIMQFLMTAGLSHEKSNRATNMIYTNMLFALLFDRLVFGTVPGLWSLLGSGLILGSAIYVAVQKVATKQPNRGDSDVETALLGEEQRAMMDDVDGIRQGEGLPLMEIGIIDHDEEREGRSRNQRIDLSGPRGPN